MASTISDAVLAWFLFFFGSPVVKFSYMNTGIFVFSKCNLEIGTENVAEWCESWVLHCALSTKQSHNQMIMEDSGYQMY